MDEKAALLKEYGVNNLIIHPFDHAFSRLTAEEFVKDILVGQLNICRIIIGHDHRFGRNRTATIQDLVQYGEEYGFEVEEISALEVNEVSVSSTKIRNALNSGDVKTANEFLGYPYFLTGRVIHGRQLGRTIGFPTANIAIQEDYKLIPAFGVYAVSSVINGKTVAGMMNIGNNPTVGGTAVNIEVHYLDFTDDLYGQDIVLHIHQWQRDEEKFESVEALRDQLEKDRLNTLEYFKNHPL